MKKTRLLIADDHSVVRKGIRMLLKSSPAFRVVAEASDGEQAVKLSLQHHPDVVIMDISMPKLNGIEATSVIKRENPNIKVVILTVHEDEEYVYQILRAGASGYVLKSAGKKEIFAAIKSAVSGGRFFSPGVSEIIVDAFVRRAKETGVILAHAPMSTRSTLTKRETEVLTCIAQGQTNRMIADVLFLSVHTVNTHRTNLMKKLNIHDTAGLVRYAVESGFIQLQH